MRKQLKSLMWLRRRIILSNKSLLIQVLLPFGITYIYRKLYEVQGTLNAETKFNLLVTCLSMALLFGAGNTISTIVSEEREKKTLRTLLLSGVKTKNYIISTLVFPFAISLASALFIPKILELDLGKQSDTYYLIVLLTAVAIMLIYLLIGMVCKTQISSQIVSLPVTMISLFIPTFSGMSDTFDTVIKYSHMGLYINALSDFDHFKWQDQKASLIALIIWILVFALLVFVQAKRIRKIS